MEKNKLSIWRKIYFWWKYKARYYHRDFIKGIKNLTRWFPVIWKDCDWDHHFIYAILIQKLTFQAKYIRKHGLHVDHIRDAERMELCVRLMKVVSEQHYQMLYSDYYESEFHFDPIDKDELDKLEGEFKEDLKGSCVLRIEETWEDYDAFFKKYPHAYREVTKTDKYIFENNTKRKIAMNMGYYLHKKANRILFKLLERHLESWWD